jgi:hypothetical protein
MICAEALWSDWLLLISHKPHLVEQPDREIRLLILRGLEAVFWEPF